MSRRKRFRYWAPTGFPAPAGGAGLVSVKISVAAGGEVKSLVLSVHLAPRWQLAHPACSKSWRPWATSVAERPPRRRLDANGACGVRTAARTHSFKAVSAGIWVVLPGSVSESCGRPAFGLVNALTTHGGVLMSPLSAISRPWLGSSVPVAGWPWAGASQGTGAARLPGPDTLRMFASKS